MKKDMSSAYGMYTREDELCQTNGHFSLHLRKSAVAKIEELLRLEADARVGWVGCGDGRELLSIALRHPHPDVAFDGYEVNPQAMTRSLVEWRVRRGSSTSCATKWILKRYLSRDTIRTSTPRPSRDDPSTCACTRRPKVSFAFSARCGKKSGTRPTCESQPCTSQDRESNASYAARESTFFLQLAVCSTAPLREQTSRVAGKTDAPSRKGGD